MGRRPYSAAVAAAGIALAACAGAEPDHTFDVREQDGVIVAVNRLPAGDTLAAEAPVVRVGAVDGPVAFGRLADVKATADGGFVVADGQGGVLRHERDGAHVGELGRPGEGPGEIGGPHRLVVVGDSVWVWSLDPRRLSLFHLDGGFGRTVRIEKSGAGLPFHPVEGGFIDEVEWGHRIDPRPARAALVRLREGAAPDTLVRPWPVPEFGWEIVDEATQTGMMVQPPTFSVRRPWTVCAGRIFLADPAAGEVHAHALDGALASRIVLPRGARPITEADREAHLRAMAERFGVPEDQLARARESVRFADMAPRVTGLVCGDGGEVWVADFDPSVPEPFDAIGTAWDVLDVEGRIRLRVRFPSGFALTDVRDGRAFGIGTGELGVPVAEVYDVSG